MKKKLFLLPLALSGLLCTDANAGTWVANLNPTKPSRTLPAINNSALSNNGTVAMDPTGYSTSATYSWDWQAAFPGDQPTQRLGVMTTVNDPATITAKENNGPSGGSAYIYGGLHTSISSYYSASVNGFNTSNTASVYNSANTDTKTIVGTGTGSDFRSILLDAYGGTTLSFKIDVWAEYSYSHSGPTGTSGTITAPENQIRISNVSLSTP